MIKQIIQTITLAIAFASTAAANSAKARNSKELPPNAEITMVVSGKLSIDRDGYVQSIKIDRSNKISKNVTNFIENGIRKWQFDPRSIKGAEVTLDLPMQVRLVGKPLNDGQYQMSMKSVNFGDHDNQSDDSVTSGKLRPPRYPPGALRMGIQGQVVLLVQVGKNGHVIDTVAHQVNLRVSGTDQEMRNARDILAKASVAAARRWKFTPPASGPEVGQDHWTVSVPVDFSLDDSKTAYGVWEAYLPGPLSNAPWYGDKIPNFGALDLLPAGKVHMADVAKQGPQLITSLNP